MKLKETSRRKKNSPCVIPHAEMPPEGKVCQKPLCFCYEEKKVEWAGSKIKMNSSLQEQSKQ